MGSQALTQIKYLTQAKQLKNQWCSPELTPVGLIQYHSELDFHSNV